jgi:hypothetical protein
LKLDKDKLIIEMRSIPPFLSKEAEKNINLMYQGLDQLKNAGVASSLIIKTLMNGSL